MKTLALVEFYVVRNISVYVRTHLEQASSYRCQTA